MDKIILEGQPISVDGESSFLNGCISRAYIY